MNIGKIFDLSNKTIVITGAAGFLGSQYAEGLSQVGANVVLADINYKECQRMSNYLKKEYLTNPLAVKLDLTKSQSINSMVQKILKKFEKIQ